MSTPPQRWRSIFGMLLLMFFRIIPNENRDLLNIILGALGTAWISATAFWFGSTRESGRKTELLAQSTPGK